MSRSGRAIIWVALLQCFAGVCVGLTQAPLEALRNAPDTIEIDGVAFQLEAEVWRDFMPTAFPDEATRLKESATDPGRPMTATLRIRAGNSRQIPPGVKVDVGWVILEDQIWESRALEDLPRDSARRQITVYLRDGPKWPPGARVEIVVRVVDTAGVAHLLSSRDQRIRAAT